jgi:hypothetical protein
MVKCYSLFFLAIWSPFFSSAQHVIPKVGITYSRAFRNPGDSDFVSRKMMFMPGLLVGAAVELPVTKRLHLQTEILYVQKGHRVEERAVNGSNYLKTQDYRLNFIEAPFLVRWTMVDRNVNLYLHSGVTVAYGLRGSVKSHVEMEYQSAWIRASSERTIQFTGFEEERPNDLYLDKRMDIGLQLGVGSLFFKTVHVEVRFTRGLTAFQYDPELIGHNQSLQVTAGLPFTWSVAQFNKVNRPPRRRV